MKNGVPFEKIFDIDFFQTHEREAMNIVFSELEGGEFDWNSWAWVQKE